MLFIYRLLACSCSLRAAPLCLLAADDVIVVRCLIMLVFVTSLWVTEAMPYFVTALLIPVLVVLMDILESSDGGEGISKSGAPSKLQSPLENLCRCRKEGKN